MKYIFITYILGSIFYLISSLFVELIRNKWRKEANYNCAICKVWDCPALYCRKKGEKNGK